jgi:hypothetical protein
MINLRRSLSKWLNATVVVVILAACASPEEKQAYVRATSDLELCMSWMTSAPMNQYQSARIDEIRRRGLDCRKYGNIAEEQRKARADFQGVVNGLSGNRKINPVPPPMGITNCTDQGAGVFVCSGPKGMVSCTDRGVGVLSCQ